MIPDPNGIATDEEIASWYLDGEGPWIKGTGHIQLSRAVNRIRADAGRTPTAIARDRRRRTVEFFACVGAMEFGLVGLAVSYGLAGGVIGMAIGALVSALIARFILS